MRYGIYLARKAKKELSKLDPQIRERVLSALITPRGLQLYVRAGY